MFLKKAFDTIDHRILIAQVKFYHEKITGILGRSVYFL